MRHLAREDFFALVEKRSADVRDYLVWARTHDGEDSTLRMSARPDIQDAADAAEAFSEQWWGVVVFTCFGAKLGASAVAPYFQRPVAAPRAREILDQVQLPAGSIGHHRIQPGHKGAKQALVAACLDHELFHDVLHSREDFDTRYRRVRAARMTQWGRTTSFDLFLRAGALGIGGAQYKPEIAYLGGSTGPKKGFARVWGAVADDDATVEWAEDVLRVWTEEWAEVAERVGVEWRQPPLEPCDQENFLCIYQERL